MNIVLSKTRLYQHNYIVSRKKDEIHNSKEHYPKKTLRNKLLLKLYNTKYLRENTKNTESFKLNILINNMNEQLNIQYDHIFQKFISKNIKLFDIILIHFKIKYLEEYFAKRSNKYSEIDKIDFYNFLLVFNEMIDEINESNDEIY